MPEGRSQGTGEAQQIAKEIFGPLDLHGQWEQRFLPLQGQTGESRPPRSPGWGIGGVAGSRGT